MSINSMLFLILSFALFYFLLLNMLSQNKMSKDLLFFLFANIILAFTLCIFYFYFYDEYIAFFISFLFMINNYFIVREIKHIYKRYIIYSIPYFIFSVYVFSYLLISLFKR